MFKDKKGVIGETINLGLAAIIIVVLAIIFFIFSSLSKSGISGSLIEESENLMLKQEAEQSLIAYLKTPVQIKRNGIDQEITIADLIRLAKNEVAYEDILKSRTIEIFDSVYSEYYISVGDLVIRSNVEETSKIKEKMAFIDIPLNANEDKIRIMLMIK